MTSAPTCPTCGGPVRIVALANGDLDRETTAKRGRYRCPKCGRVHPNKRSRSQHLRFCDPMGRPDRLPTGTAAEAA